MLERERSLARAPTTNDHLRARIAELVDLTLANDIDGFVDKFIPRDLSSDDREYFLSALKTDRERWTMLKLELATIDAGANDARVSAGDQKRTCEFRFQMPGATTVAIDREVEFANYALEGDAAEDWRAVG